MTNLASRSPRVGWSLAISFWLTQSLVIPAAAAIIDQDNSGYCGSLGITTEFEWQQGITAGIAGELARIEIRTETDRPLPLFNISLFRGAPWQAGDAMITKPAVRINAAWSEAKFGEADFFVEPGDMFTIGLQDYDNASTGITINCDFEDGDSYHGGTLWLNGSPHSYDVSFRTFVRVVPEPSTGVLMCAGLALLGFASAWWINHQRNVLAHG